MIYCGDSLEVLKGFEDNSIDAVVTDPPYGLTSITKRFGIKGSAPAKHGKDGSFARLSKGFMGKEWDGSGIEYNVELWEEVFRVLKPGGHLLAFTGTRTYHRIATAIEDAGFEIRDMIAWVYGSGFPKSLNIGKAVDKLQGNKREDLGKGVPTGSAGDVMKKGMKKNYNITKGNSPWEGWGTALKPALEPITVARKPIKGTVANNVLEYGTGGLNIDGSRVGFAGNKDKEKNNKSIEAYRNSKPDNSWKNDSPLENANPQNPQGRFPANFIHDGSDEVVELFPDTKSPKTYTRKSDGFGTSSYVIGEEAGKESLNYGDSGSAARFFYCAKASKSERNKGLEGFEDIKLDIGDDRPSGSFNERFGHNEPKPTKNAHPTVKPVKLMQYLVRLVTPKGGTVLDPFTGSGTTGIACKLESFEFIGIEREQEYVDIAQARIDAWEPDPQQELL